MLNNMNGVIICLEQMIELLNLAVGMEAYGRIIKIRYSFDCAIANHMLYHVQNRDLAIREIARILKSDGTFHA
jgi:SAM-dependent methyltransferase